MYYNGYNENSALRFFFQDRKFQQLIRFRCNDHFRDDFAAFDSCYYRKAFNPTASTSFCVKIYWILCRRAIKVNFCIEFHEINIATEYSYCTCIWWEKNENSMKFLLIHTRYTRSVFKKQTKVKNAKWTHIQKTTQGRCMVENLKANSERKQAT